MSYGGNANGDNVPWNKSCADPAVQTCITYNRPPPRYSVNNGISNNILVPITSWINPTYENYTMDRHYDPNADVPVMPDNVPKFTSPNKPYQY